ncbi:MAG: hypothetical protein SOH80_09505 [Eubacteriales bacterium]|jgi:hypothetical protein
MEDLTIAQKLLIRYCRQRNYQEILPTGSAGVRAVDAEGRIRDLTINIYGDVMDQRTRKMIAEGNTSHDLLKVYETPTEWRDLKPSVKEQLRKIEVKNRQNLVLRKDRGPER